MESNENFLPSLFRYVDSHRDQFVGDLRRVVNIPSVSALATHIDDVTKMMSVMAQQLRKLRVKVEMCDIGKRKMPNGMRVNLPPVILGTLSDDESKPTVLIYGHLDVYPAVESDGWDSLPFCMVTKSGKMYGRGTTKDKGPILAWLHAVEAYQNTSTPLPINLKFCFEGMGECDSQGLEKLLKERRPSFLSDVDYVCLIAGSSLGTMKPSLTRSLLGISSFSLKIKCVERDSQSEVHEESINEAMADLKALLDSIVDEKGNIRVPGIDPIQPFTPVELLACKKETDTEQSLQGTKEQELVARRRYPSLSIHGIEGAFAGPSTEGIVPITATGKFSIRLSADQNPYKVCQKIETYLREKLAARGSKNTMEFCTDRVIHPWKTDPKHQHFQAAIRAIRKVHDVEPDLTQSDRTIPVVSTLASIADKNVLLMSMGGSDDGAHEVNEKLHLENYFEGTKVMAAYFYEVGKIGKSGVGPTVQPVVEP